MRWIVATRNPDKFREIQSILTPSFGELLFLADLCPDSEVKESFLTLKENALEKAREASRITRLPSVGEDTGLFVYGLDGAPGVFSARFAGEGATYKENREKLLRMLEDLPLSARRAYFLCVAVAIDQEGIVYHSRGEVHGIITEKERGREGFGYDPVFLYPPLGRTFAEISPKVKNRISHRAIALKGLIGMMEKR